MSTLNPSPHKIWRTKEETSGTGCDGGEESVVITLLDHFDENDFLEFRVGAMKKLKMKLQEVDMLLQLCEKELGVDKMRRFRKEVEDKLGSQLVSSDLTSGSISLSKVKVSTVRIDNRQSSSPYFFPGDVKQMKRRNKRSFEATKDGLASSLIADPITSRSSNFKEDKYPDPKEGGISTLQGSSGELKEDGSGATANLGDTFKSTTKVISSIHTTKVKLKSANMRTHQSPNPAEGVGSLGVTKRKNRNAGNDNEVSARENGEGDEDDLAHSQAVVELLKNGEDTPEKVLEQIEWGLTGRGSQFEFTVIGCKAIRVGSYRVWDHDAGPLRVTLTPLGIKFKLRHSNSEDRKVNICIPKKNILSIYTVLLNEKLPAISLKTCPRYASWIRDVLGMEGNPGDEQTNFYCPQKGSYRQQFIVLMAEALSELDQGLIRKVFSNTLKEIDRRTAKTK